MTTWPGWPARGRQNRQPDLQDRLDELEDRQSREDLDEAPLPMMHVDLADLGADVDQMCCCLAEADGRHEGPCCEDCAPPAA